MSITDRRHIDYSKPTVLVAFQLELDALQGDHLLWEPVLPSQRPPVDRPYTGNDLRDYVIGLVERTAVAHEEAPDGIHPHIVPLGVLAALQMLDNAMPVAQEDQ
jgi:hypothetical protein